MEEDEAPLELEGEAGDSLESPPAPPRRRGKSEAVLDTLLDQITTGALAPGEKLPSERALAQQLKVSRVSVRAALERLKTQGFVTAVQGGGTSVVSSAAAMEDALSILISRERDHLFDLAEIRMALETWAARRAAERASEQDIAAIREAFERMDQAGERGKGTKEDKAQADMDFHYAIARAAHSPVYQHMLTVIRDTLATMLEFHRTRLFGRPADDEAVLQQHEAILDAVTAREPDLAEAAMETHLSWVLGHYRHDRGE